LSARIAMADDGCFVLGVDALFRAILRKGIVNHIKSTQATVRHFLTRRRFQNAERTVAESPLDYTSLDVDILTDPNVLGSTGGAVRAYARAIDAMADAAHKTSWATFDLHPEFAYVRLRRLIPGLKLAGIFRDPREAIAAVLYWRRPGETFGHTRREFRRALMLWGMAAAAVLAHKERWPEDVCVITLPQLLGENDPMRVFGIAVRTGMDEDIIGGALHFQRSANGFSLPDGSEAQLLSKREQAEICALLAPLARAVGVNMTDPDPDAQAGLALRIYFEALTGIASRQPRIAAALMDFIENPAGVVRLWISLLRESAAALLHARHLHNRPAE